MVKNIIVSAVVALVVALGIAFALPDGDTAGALGGETKFSLINTTGGYEVDGTTVIDGSGNVDAPITSTTVYTETVTLSTAVSSVTATAAQTGSTVLMARATGTVITLPAAADGLFFRFVVGTAFATDNYVIDSAEGDNIEGALIVAGAVVDCDAEDQINFVADGENLGDYVELLSDGTSWFILDSGGLTAAKITCTDPS